MIPAEFDYAAPRSVKEAVELYGRLPDAKLLAGGMSLIPALKHRLVQPATLVDLAGIDELRGVSQRRGRVEIGSMVTHGELASGGGCGTPLPLEAVKRLEED